MNPFYDNWVDITYQIDHMQLLLFATAAGIYWLGGMVQHHRGQR